MCQILTVVCRCHSSDSKLFNDQVGLGDGRKLGGEERGERDLSHSDTQGRGRIGGTLTIQSSKSVPWVTVTQLYYKCF